MIREAEVTDDALPALFYQIVEDAVVDEACVEGLHATHAYAVEQIIVDVVDLKFLERGLEELHRSLVALRFGSEVRHLRGHEILAPLVPMQGYARGVFRLSLAIGGRCIEIVYAMFDGIVYESVHHLLVYRGIF